ncbi:MAG TPA: hypothetical protein VFA49_03745, partial [Chloroflexota bacterium]|nr:hypothetical protein [Chloroflexota bacterium]
MNPKLDPTPTPTRVSRLLSISAALLLALLMAACGGAATPTPTPDPFNGLADRSDQAFREGLELYGEGQYRDALNAFERARVLSPSGDPRISQMIERTRGALEPTATPAPPTPTALPVPPTPTPVARSTATPDEDLGLRYFGKVVLTVVPSRNVVPGPASQFFYQDQIGLWMEALDKHLRLPFVLRVFNADSSRLVAEVGSETTDAATPAATTATRLAGAPTSGTPSAGGRGGANTSSAQVSLAAGTPTPAATPGPTDFQLARFWDNFVWYHAGGEEPGRYRLELYANGTLTHTFDYTVGTVPIAPPEVPTTVPALDENPSLPSIPADMPPPPPARPSRTSSEAAAAPAAPTATPPPTATPMPTAMPTPASAGAMQVGGVPAGLDINLGTGRVYLADGSGVVWTTDQQRPQLGRPFNLGRLPVDLAVDQTTGNVYVSARSEPSLLVIDGNTGRRLASITMPVTPGDVQVDSELGLLYVVLPERQALGVVDVRSGRLVRYLNGLPQVTGLALDPLRHVLFASHLGGQVSVIDVPSSQLVERVGLTGAGLSGVATARGLAYGVNPATRELAVLEPVSQSVNRYALRDELAAVAASEDNGSVYVLTARPNTIVRVDPTDGAEVGRVLLGDRSGRFGVAPSVPLLNRDFQGLRARMVLSRADESVYVSLPELGSMAVVA